MAGSTWIDSVNAAYPAMARLYDANEASRAAADQGYFVCSGADVVASGTAGKLKVNTGTIYSSTTEVNITSAIDNIACCTDADATNPRWAILEIDNSATPNTPTANLNLGTAAASPLMPTLTAGRSAHAWIYIPANATVVDALNSSPNGNAKIIDARQLRTVHPARVFGADTSQTKLTNPTTIASILNSTITIPGNSLNVGDTFIVRASGEYNDPTTARTMTIQQFFGASTTVNYTTASLSTSATNRQWSLTSWANVTAIGATGGLAVGGDFAISIASLTPQVFDNAVGITQVYAPDTTANIAIDLKVRINTGDASAFIQLEYFTVTKIPA